MNARSNPQQKVRIVIADDHTVLRESLAALLATQPDFAVEGLAADGREALLLVQRHQPDVLLLDLFMPRSDGELDYVQVVKLGGRGLVLKSDGPQKLFAAIRTVAAGELAFSEQLAQQVLSTMSSENKGTAHALARLSGREREIAEHVTRGMKNKSIAQSLNISENTVKRHLQSIFTKTGARDRLELAVIALSDFNKAA